MLIAAYLCDALVASVLLAAATGKALWPEAFAASLKAADVSPIGVRILSVGVPLAEALTALALVALAHPLVGFVAAGTLLTVFTAWLLRAVASGKRHACACFGSVGAAIGWRTIARNLVLLLLATAGFIASPQLSRRVIAQPETLTWVVALTLIWLLASALQQARPVGTPSYYSRPPTANHAEKSCRTSCNLQSLQTLHNSILSWCHQARQTRQRHCASPHQ